MVLKKFLHKQMTEKIAFEAGIKNGQQNLKYNFLDAFFTSSKKVRQIPKKITQILKMALKPFYLSI